MLKAKFYSHTDGHHQRGTVFCESVEWDYHGMLCTYVEDVEGEVDIINFKHSENHVHFVVNKNTFFSVMEV